MFSGVGKHEEKKKKKKKNGNPNAETQARERQAPLPRGGPSSGIATVSLFWSPDSGSPMK
jgi:hypothetical protein